MVAKFLTDEEVARKEAQKKPQRQLPEKPSKPLQPKVDRTAVEAAKHSAEAAKQSLSAANSSTEAVSKMNNGLDTLSASQEKLVSALQDVINNSSNVSERKPVRLKVNRSWDAQSKANLIDSIDILPLTVKA